MMIWKNSFFILFAKKRVDTLPTRVIISDESPEDIWNNVGFFYGRLENIQFLEKFFRQKLTGQGRKMGIRGSEKNCLFFSYFESVYVKKYSKTCDEVCFAFVTMGTSFYGFECMDVWK